MSRQAQLPSQHGQLAASSVTFKWEEAPGKPRPCRELPDPTDLGPLQLPPRLQWSHGFDVCHRSPHQTHPTKLKMKLYRCVASFSGQHTVSDPERKAITPHRRAASCIFGRTTSIATGSAVLAVASVDACSSPFASDQDELDSQPDSSAIDPAFAADTAASPSSSCCPDLSPDVEEKRTYRKELRLTVVSERFRSFLRSWFVLPKMRRKQTKQTEMWSPTLATYLYQANELHEEEEGDSSSPSGMASRYALEDDCSSDGLSSNTSTAESSFHIQSRSATPTFQSHNGNDDAGERLPCKRLCKVRKTVRVVVATIKVALLQSQGHGRRSQGGSSSIPRSWEEIPPFARSL